MRIYISFVVLFFGLLSLCAQIPVGPRSGAPLSREAWGVTTKRKPGNATSDVALLGSGTFNGRSSGVVIAASCETREYGPVPVVLVQVPISLGFPVPGTSNSQSPGPTIVRMSNGERSVGPTRESGGHLTATRRNYVFFFDLSASELKALAQPQALTLSIQIPGTTLPLDLSFMLPAASEPLQPVLDACDGAGTKAAPEATPQSAPTDKPKYEIRGITVGMRPDQVAAIGRTAGLSVSALSKQTIYRGAAMSLTDPGFQYSGQARVGTSSLRISVEFSVLTQKAVKVSAWEGAIDSSATNTSGRLYDAGVQKWGKPNHIYWGDPKGVHAQYDWNGSRGAGQPIALTIIDPVAKAASDAALNPQATVSKPIL